MPISVTSEEPLPVQPSIMQISMSIVEPKQVISLKSILIRLSTRELVQLKNYLALESTA